jgi:hypothetical protein
VRYTSATIPRMSARRRFVAAISTLVIASAVACGNPDKGPSVLATASSDASPSDSSSSQPATPLTDSSQAGSAEQFVHSYFSTFNEGQASGDMTATKALANATCSTCIELTDNVERYFAQGGRVEGGAWEVKSVSYNDSEQNSVLVNATASIAAANIVDTNGSVLESYEGTPVLGFIFNVAQDGQGSWFVVDLVALGPQQ